jgi:hypothetical protein
LLGRVVWFVASLAILILAFFFAAAAIVAGAILAAALLSRIWWVNRKVRKAAEEQFITTEYAVVERESQVERLPDDSGRPQPPRE